jgi:hypothetical protein
VIPRSRNAPARRTAHGVILATTLLVALAAGGATAPEGRAKPVASAAADPNLSGSVRSVRAASPPLVAPGPPPDIVILFTGRVIGFVEPCG